MRNWLLRTGVLAGGLFVLTGCVAGPGPGGVVTSSVSPSTAAAGSASTSNPAPTTGSGSGGVVTLSLWTGFTGPDGPAYQALVQQFNATHRDVQVTMDVQPWDAIGQQLPVAWAAGQGPDLATPGLEPGSIAGYVKSNSVLPLESAVGAGADQLNADAFPSSVTRAFTVNGHLYAAPANVAPVALYYNKAMFAAAGLSGPPRTQDELIADVRKLTVGGANPSQYGISLADHQTTPMWPVLLWINGGAIVGDGGCAAITRPSSVQALTTWADLLAQDHVSPIDQSGPDADSLFAAKRAAMELNGPQAAGGFRAAGVDFGVAPVPVGPAGPVTIASTVPLMISKSTPHQAQALEFLSWWTSRTAQSTFSARSGFPPVRTDMTVSDPDAEVFAAALPSVRLYLAGMPQAAQVDSEVYTPLLRQISRARNVQQSLNSAASAINEMTGCKG
jgi:multiple sugar transport system substrate-binding protein